MFLYILLGFFLCFLVLLFLLLFYNKIPLKNKNIFSFPFTAIRNARCDTMKITIFLLYSSHNSLLYSCTMVYACSCFFFFFFVLYLCLTLIYICCYNQYLLMRKIQHCTILSVLRTRLVCTVKEL